MVAAEKKPSTTTEKLDRELTLIAIKGTRIKWHVIAVACHVFEHVLCMYDVNDYMNVHLWAATATGKAFFRSTVLSILYSTHSTLASSPGMHRARLPVPLRIGAVCQVGPTPASDLNTHTATAVYEYLMQWYTFWSVQMCTDNRNPMPYRTVRILNMYE